ncbi:MAG: Hsp20/alpha crystallin family protein, partial [Burkholderiales bacterium]|nr:Hsp20/alpha crystallin family protein [Burkholderiales bacterium]
MANLQRFDPFQELDDMLRGLVFRPVRMAHAPQIESIRIDATEDDKAYRITADIPGVHKEDIRISVDDNEVTITAESSSDKEEKEGERVVLRERAYGAMSRTLTLPQAVDDDNAQARYENGVLTLTLP